MSNIVHIQTQIQTVLGRLDDDGNVVETFQLTAQPTTLDGEVWAEQARLLREKRDEIAGQAEAQSNGKVPDEAHAAGS
jgi:hypothetical protein